MEAEPWDGASEYFAAMSQSQLLAVLLGTTALLQALYRAGRTPPPPPPEAAGPTALEQAAQQRQARADARRRSRAAPVALDGAVGVLRQLCDDYRYLEAGEGLEALRGAISAAAGSSEARAAQGELEVLLADGRFESRVATSREALAALSDETQTGWTVVKDNADMRMQTRNVDGGIAVKIDAVIEGVRPADTLMIWREAQLYPKWFPLITQGAKIHEMHPGELVLHLVCQTFFLYADLVLHGWGCDALSEGFFLLCVRPARAAELPGVALPPHPKLTAKAKLIPPVRALASIDVLVEPLSEHKVRFAFQLVQKMPPMLPSWCISYILENGLADIFTAMKRVGRAMATDPKSAHARHVASDEYRPVAAYLRGKIDGFIATLGPDGAGVPGRR